jgi:hypothetical protein
VRHDPDVRVFRVSWLVIVALAACSKADGDAPPAQQPVAPGTAGDAPPPQLAGACDRAMKHVFELMKKSGDRDLAKESDDEETVANAIADCKRQAWPAEMLECSGTAADIATINDKCNKLAFGSSALDMKPGRIFRADGTQEEKDRIHGAIPKMFALDGDFEIFDKATHCGAMKKKRFGVQAMFVVCSNRVVIGPLTTALEIAAMMKELPSAAAGGPAAMSALAAKYPPGCPSCRYTTYDATGKPIAN